MNETGTKIFICEICGKDFDKKRPKICHASYCRKRLRDPPQPRKKSCVACTKSKTSCDRSQNNPCSTCLKKGTICRYEDGRSPKATIRAGNGAPSSGSDTASSRSSIGPEPSNKKYRSSAGSTSHVELERDILRGLRKPGLDADLDVRSEGIRTGDVFGIAPVFSFFEPIPTGLSTSQSIPIASVCAQLSPSISRELPLKPYRAFNTRLSAASHSSLLAKYIYSTLCSYSRMNIGENQLPPFIHPEGARQGRRALPCSMSGRMLDRLTACSAITTWWSKNTEDRKFMWNVIRMEQERLLEECVGGVYDDWQAVAALQAICVYLLLRLEESDGEKMTFDIPLIRTMSKITARVQGLTAKYSNLSDSGSAWERWILVESLRRTLIVILIIGYLFDMTPGYEQLDCADDRYLLEMRLPSAASLWDASSREVWETGYLSQENFRQPCVGDLFRRTEESDGVESGLKTWLGDVDSLGTLIVAVAALARTG